MLRKLASVVIIVACLAGLGRAQPSGNPIAGGAQSAAKAAQNTVAPGSSAAANQTAQFVASGSAQQVAQGAADFASNTAVPGGRWLANATGQWVFGRSPESLELLGKTSLTFLDLTAEGLHDSGVIRLSPVFRWTSGAVYVISPFADFAKATAQEDKVGQSDARFEVGMGAAAGILSVVQPEIGIPLAISMGSFDLVKAGLRSTSSEDTVNNAEHRLLLAPYHAFQGLNEAVKSTAQTITLDVGRNAARAGIEAALGDLALPISIDDSKEQTVSSGEATSNATKATPDVHIAEPNTLPAAGSDTSATLPGDPYSVVPGSLRVEAITEEGKPTKIVILEGPKSEEPVLQTGPEYYAPTEANDLQQTDAMQSDLPSDQEAAQLIAQAHQQNADLVTKQRDLSEQATSLSDQFNTAQDQVAEIQAEDQKSYEASLRTAEAEWNSHIPVFQPSVEFDPISAFGGLNGFMQTYINRFLRPGPNFPQGSGSSYDPCAMGPALGYRAACGSGSTQSKVQGQQSTPTSAAPPTACGPGYQTNPGALMAAQAPWNPLSKQPPPWRDPKYGPLDSSGRVAWCVPGGK